MIYLARITLAMTLCGMCTQVALAQKSIGNGTLGISGSIEPETCVVMPPSIDIPQISTQDVGKAPVAWVLKQHSFKFNFASCGSLANTVNISFTRDAEPPTGLGEFAGGFVWTGGIVSDGATAPLYYTVDVNNENIPLASLAGGISVKADSDHSLSTEIKIRKAPGNGVAPNQYSGNYSASLSWSLEYP
ncbi:hypothetical protein EGM70_02580 [Enterobacteriaceae bacterium 89]|nr:hypothetical protein [Enterobacteriaceae bacterium 89]